METKITITNAKGLVAVPTQKLVITDHALGVLKNSVASIDDEQNRSQVERLLELLDNLPNVGCTQDSDLLAGSNDFKRRLATGAQTVGMSRCVLVPGPFMGSRDLYSKNFEVSATAQGLGWEHAEEILELARQQRQHLNSIGITVLPRGLKSAMKALASLAELNISGDRLCDLVEGKTYAIYRSESNGYIDDKGMPRPLSSARLFPSAEAARRTAKAQKIDDAVIVEASIQVREITTVINNKPGSQLHSALAELQAKTLDAGTAPSARGRMPIARM
jgi:hypothetical protein